MSSPIFLSARHRLGWAGSISSTGPDACRRGGRPPKEIAMAAVCDVCAKKPTFGHNVPWSKKKTNRRWNPNIQRVRAVVDGTPKRLNVCTSCLKAGKVSR